MKSLNACPEFYKLSLRSQGVTKSLNKPAYDKMVYNSVLMQTCHHCYEGVTLLQCISVFPREGKGTMALTLTDIALPIIV